ncbi:transport protein particle component, Bet3 [Oesophagostomum dentatum]|uniref:Transport protein particle component, Bet3 n=1 Tax=Oesophagostomum dentatum TaxID=61180 RepID=A0A0B1TJP3_OESDE|nr:transport protein particle component, Bet3 [Oesophagostomum dentatum]
MVKSTGILDKTLSKGKSEVSLSTFALLFSEVVKYAQERSETVTDIHDKLASYGKIVGIRLLDVVTLREKGYRRETKLLGMLMFIKSSVWKNLFGKEADKLERSNDDQCTCKLQNCLFLDLGLANNSTFRVFHTSCTPDWKAIIFHFRCFFSIACYKSPYEFFAAPSLMHG